MLLPVTAQLRPFACRQAVYPLKIQHSLRRQPSSGRRRTARSQVVSALAAYAPARATRSTSEISTIQAFTCLRKDLSVCQHGSGALTRCHGGPRASMHQEVHFTRRQHPPRADNLLAREIHAPHSTPNLGVCTTHTSISSLLLSCHVSFKQPATSALAPLPHVSS